MAWPKKTGITTIKLFLRQVCRLITKYRHVLEEILTESQMNYVNALEQACNDFMDNVPTQEPVI